MNEKSNAEYFGSFLRSIQEPEEEQQQAANLSFKLMTALSAAGRVEVSKLMSESSLSLNEFMEAVKQLQDKGLVELEESEGVETIGLSAAAEQIVRALTLDNDE